MPPQDLPGIQVLGRPLKPVALGFAGATGYLALNNVTESGVFAGAPLVSNLLGVAFAVTCVLLCVGWWARSQRLAEWGLLAAFACLISRFIGTGLIAGFGLQPIPAWPSLWWAVIAGGAFLLERADPRAG